MHNEVFWGMQYSDVPLRAGALMLAKWLPLKQTKQVLSFMYGEKVLLASLNQQELVSLE